MLPVQGVDIMLNQTFTMKQLVMGLPLSIRADLA
jgi:hypothetical protein